METTSQLIDYAGCDALTKDIGHIILINVCMEQIEYGDYFVGNPRHTNYIDRKNGREWRTID